MKPKKTQRTNGKLAPGYAAKGKTPNRYSPEYRAWRNAVRTNDEKRISETDATWHKAHGWRYAAGARRG